MKGSFSGLNEGGLRDVTKVYQLVESFESGDISGYSGATGSYSAVQDQSIATQGDWYLESNAGSSSIIYNGGLSPVPYEGDRFAFDFWMQNGNDDDVGIVYGPDTGDGQNAYRVRFRGDSGVIVFKNIMYNSTNFSFTSEKWYTGVIDWTVDGDHTVELYERGNLGVSPLATVSDTDSQYSGGGIGFWANASNNNGTKRYDNVRIL